MGFFDGYNVATSGMSAQRTRINVCGAISLMLNYTYS